jgi:hypothetical protein
MRIFLLSVLDGRHQWEHGEQEEQSGRWESVGLQKQRHDLIKLSNF